MTKEEYLRKVAEMQTDISAIKQKEGEESKTCNDCIHKAVCYRYSYGLPENYAEKCGDFEPSRKGHWILDEEKSLMFNVYKCSNCEVIGARQSNFCPNCGADMRTEDKGDYAEFVEPFLADMRGAK